MLLTGTAPRAGQDGTAACVAAVIEAPVALGLRPGQPAPSTGAAPPPGRAAAVVSCRAPTRIDRGRLRRVGATAIWLDRHGGWAETVRGNRGTRPWTTPLPQAWPRQRIDLPLAPAGA